MGNFKASVQYGDWKGTAAADNADQNDLSDYLQGKGLMNENEFPIASSLWVGENHGGKLGTVMVTAYLFHKPDHATVNDALNAIYGPITVREIDVEVSLTEYIGFFKRFSVFNTRRGLDINEREFTTTE
jgi:hypothetical protein